MNNNTRRMVNWVDAYVDGTFTFSLVGSCSRHSTVCIDGRINSPTRFRLFEGFRHPNSPLASLVELGDEAEGIVIPLISHWIDSGEINPFFNEYGVKKLLETIIRFGEPQLEEIEGEPC